MTGTEATPPTVPQASYWQAASTTRPEFDLIDALRSRLVGLVGALVVQGSIALMGMLPRVPGVPDPRSVSDPYSYPNEPTSFWVQFAVMSFVAAIVVSLAFGPGVRLADLATAGRVVLGLSFLVVPAIAIVVGAIDGARGLGAYDASVAPSYWLSTAFYSVLFFGLPLIALGGGGRRASSAPTPR